MSSLSSGLRKLPLLSADSRQGLLIGGRQVFTDHSRMTDISISASSDPSTAVRAFGAEAVKISPYVSVASGGTCNCFGISGFAPHLHGTHTESRGHILSAYSPAATAVTGVQFVARLITVKPERARGLGLSLVGAEDDLVITRGSVEEQLSLAKGIPEVLIIRTPELRAGEKLSANYSGTNPPYPHHELAQLLVRLGVKHLVLDLPSADREVGQLYFHRTFWGDPLDSQGKMVPGLEHLAFEPRDEHTITELAYLSPSLADGWYALYLAPIRAPGDAGPVRPLVVPILDSPWD